MDVVNAFEPNFVGINESTAKILAEELPGDIIAEIERLEQFNVEFNQIEGLDNLYCHLNKCDDDLLDAMVAEFGWEFPDFDIFNYVDPASVDELLDTGVADVLNTIDCEIRQQEFNLNRLAVEGSYDLPNPYGVGVPQRLTDPVEEVQSLRRQLQQQQQLIAGLQEQIMKLKAIQMNPPLQVEQVSTCEAQSENAEIGITTRDNNLPSPSDTSLSNTEEPMLYGPFETIQERTKQRDEVSVITQSEVDALEGKQQPQLDEPPSSMASADNLEEFQGSLRKERVVLLKRKMRGDGKRHARNVETCKSSLVTRDTLKSRQHKRAGESQSYSCNECNKSFNFKFHLTRHLRIHTGERPCVCQLCDKSFNRKENLSRHLLIHTGEMPHKCDVCKKSFRQKTHLSRHLKNHHN